MPLITHLYFALESAGRGKTLSELIARVHEVNPDVVVKGDWPLRPSVVMTVSLTDEGALPRRSTRQHGVLRRLRSG